MSSRPKKRQRTGVNPTAARTVPTSGPPLSRLLTPRPSTTQAAVSPIGPPEGDTPGTMTRRTVHRASAQQDVYSPTSSRQIQRLQPVSTEEYESPSAGNNLYNPGLDQHSTSNHWPMPYSIHHPTIPLQDPMSHPQSFPNHQAVQTPLHPPTTSYTQPSTTYLPPPQHIHSTHASNPSHSTSHSNSGWSRQDDARLVEARHRNIPWFEIQRSFFPSKTPNACRKRFERFIRTQSTGWTEEKLGRLAIAYAECREDMWQTVVERIGEDGTSMMEGDDKSDRQWEQAEKKCMEQGLSRLLTKSSRHARKRSRLSMSAGSAISPASSSAGAESSHSNPNSNPSARGKRADSAVAFGLGSAHHGMADMGMGVGVSSGMSMPSSDTLGYHTLPHTPVTAHGHGLGHAHAHTHAHAHAHGSEQTGMQRPGSRRRMSRGDGGSGVGGQGQGGMPAWHILRSPGGA